MADAETLVQCIVCFMTDTDTDQSDDQGTDQSDDQGTDQTDDRGTVQSTDQDRIERVNSSTTPCASNRKKLYPKIHSCGHVNWICSTCIIKGTKCYHCDEDLLESQVDTKESLRHTQLFTDLTMADKRENRIIFPNENTNSSPCVVHTDTNSDFFCCTHNVPVCLDCKYVYHKKCTVNSFTESFGKTGRELSDFIEKLKSMETDCEDHLKKMEVRKEAINDKLTHEFNQLRSWINNLENELKTSVEDGYNKKCQKQKVLISGHMQLIRRVFESPPDAAFFDMTQTLASVVKSIEKDITELNNVQMKFQERRENLEEAIKSLEAMRFVSRESSHDNVMGTNGTLYSSARSVSGPRGSVNINEPGMSHKTENVVYVYTCTKCDKLYVGETGRMLQIRDGEQRGKGGIIYEHICEQDEEEEKKLDVGKRQKHFVVSCVRKNLVDKDQRCMMETLIMLKLGTLHPDGINEKLSRAVLKSLEILRFQKLDGTDVVLLNDRRIANKKGSTYAGTNSYVLSCKVLKFDNLYEVLLENINNENAIIGISSQNPGDNLPEPERIPLHTGILSCRLGFAINGQYGYMYVNGVMYKRIPLQENYRSKQVVFSAYSKITGLPIQPQKTWKFAEAAWLTLYDESRTAECRSVGNIISKMPMKLNILYEIIVDELYDDHNGYSVLGIWIKTASTAPWIVHRIELIQGSRYGVIVDAQKNLHLFLNGEYISQENLRLILNGEYKGIIGKCVTLPCYFFLWCNGLKVSTLPETTVFFDQEGKIIL